MPTSIHFGGGTELKVTAPFEEVAETLDRRGVATFQRFAGFRGDEAVGAERVAVRVDAVAYAQDVPAP